MAENSEISWTDHTFNPWIGCTKVSPACANCYAERDFDKRRHVAAWGPNGTRVVTSDGNWAKPLAWNRKAESLGVRQRVFCSSLADVFEDWKGPMLDHNGNIVDASMNFLLHQLFWLIDGTPHLDWLLLTKRPENILMLWPDKTRRENVWLGTSVENQEYADKRIPELLKCRDLSPVLFLSCEPVVGQINLPGDVHCPYCEDSAADPETGVVECGTCDGTTIRNDMLEFQFDWVIAGGESGPNARPADPDWFRSLRDQCNTAGVPFHFKQFGEFDEHQVRVGKKNAGRLLDGVMHNAFPVASSPVV